MDHEMRLSESGIRSGLFNFAMLAIVGGLTLYFLIVAKNLLIPFVIAVVFWYLIDVLATTYQQLPIWRWHMPRWLSVTLAFLSFAAGLAILVSFVSANFSPQNLQQVANDFQANLGTVLESLIKLLPIKEGTLTVEYNLTEPNGSFVIEPPADCQTAASDIPIMKSRYIG